MKTAIYIEDGLVQLVITPESAFEKNALSSMRDKPMDVKLFAGGFYDCRGGWVRQTAHYASHGNMYDRNGEDKSIILTVRETNTPEQEDAN